MVLVAQVTWRNINNSCGRDSVDVMEYEAVVDNPVRATIQADAVAERVRGEIEIVEMGESP